MESKRSQLVTLRSVLLRDVTERPAEHRGRYAHMLSAPTVHSQQG